MQTSTNCHCFLEITSRVFNYEGFDRYKDDSSLKISFFQKMLSLIVIILCLIYLTYSIKKHRFLSDIQQSIFSYLDFAIPELQKPLKRLSRPMRVKKSNAVKSLSLIIMHDKDKEPNLIDFKKTTTSHAIEDKH